MRKVLITLTSLVFCFSLSAQNGSVNYDPVDGNFSIEFPAEFTIEEAGSVETGDRTVKASCVQEDHIYFAAHTIHNINLDDEEDLATVSLEAFAKEIEGEILSRNTWSHKGRKGISAELTMKGENQDASLRYNVLITSNMQYQVIVIGPIADFREKDAKRFLKSFQLD